MHYLPRSARALLGRTIRDERGFTLPELAVGIAVTLIIAAAGMTFIVLAGHQLSNQGERVSATDDARNALLAMTSEIRDATLVTIVDARTVDATVWTQSGAVENVRFSCEPDGATSRCTRTNTGTGDIRELVSGVTNDENFAAVAGSDIGATASQGGALEIDLDIALEEAQNPLRLISTVKPRNCVGSPGSGVVNSPC